MEKTGSLIVEEKAPALWTFMIADVRGYTEYTFENGDAAAARLATRFAEVVEDVVTGRDGQVLELRGDEALVLFSSARQALRAAIDLQRRFERESERDPSLPLKVGIGLDAGEAVPVHGGYRGRALNLAARLCSVAGKGEVFVSETVLHLAGKTAGVVPLERGQVQLKGIPDPVRVTQVVPADAVPESVPRFTIHATPMSNLPAQPTPFVGRERELVDVSGMLRRKEVRLLTLVGPAGTGKTRLAQQVASEVLSAYRDGVCFVPLAGVAEPDLVASTIAGALKVEDEGEHSPREVLERYLRDRQMLLVLDNFEQVLEAAALVAALLAACPELTIVVTSRAALRLVREQLYAVPPLALPNLEHLPSWTALSEYDAIALFVQRAQAVKPDFLLTGENGRTVAEICHRLDGLPLAIELAAAWLRMLPLRAVLDRLSQRLALLVGGSRDAPSRQQSLRAAIDWSYELLDPGDQTLFTRMGVFAGGCTLEAIEEVCIKDQDLEMDALTGAASLVDQSLVWPGEPVNDEPRFLMLETLREYALHRLEQKGELHWLRRRHAEYFLALAERAEPELSGADQALWLRRLDAEHDNVRAALQWALETREVEIGFRLVIALRRFWHARGYVSEGNHWLEELLAVDEDDRRADRSDRAKAARAEALTLFSSFATSQGDYDRARDLAERALTLKRELRDRAGVAKALSILGNVAYHRAEFTEASALYEESLGLRRELGAQSDIAVSLNNLGAVSKMQGDLDRAAAFYAESLAIQRRLGDIWWIALLLNSLGDIARIQGCHSKALALFQESLNLRRELGDPWGLAESLHNLGALAREQGECERAAALYAEALSLYCQVGDRWSCVECLEALAGIATTVRQCRRAARLFGAASTLVDAIDAPLTAHARSTHERDLAVVRAALGETAFAAGWRAGREMPLEKICEEVRSLQDNDDELIDESVQLSVG